MPPITCTSGHDTERQGGSKATAPDRPEFAARLLFWLLEQMPNPPEHQTLPLRNGHSTPQFMEKWVGEGPGVDSAGREDWFESWLPWVGGCVSPGT